MLTVSGRRKDDDQAVPHPRDDRYFFLDNHWYFTTREGLVMGPFDSRAQAVGEAGKYVHFVHSARTRILNLIRREKITIPLVEGS